MTQLIAILALLSVNLPYKLPTYAYYVATTGNDSTGDGSSGNPWLTLSKAAAVIRTRGILGSTAGTPTVHVAAGTYAMTSPLALDNRDSGAAGSDYTWQCDGAIDSCVLTASVAATGGSWAAYTGTTACAGGGAHCSRIAVASCPWTLIENGVRARQARTPNFVLDATFTTAKGPYFTDASGSAVNSQMAARDPTDVDMTTWTVSDDLFFFLPKGGFSSFPWVGDVLPISSATAGTGVAVFNGMNSKYTTQGGYYVVQNDLAFLDQAGEWYCDRLDNHGAAGGGNHYLYYWPNTNPIASQDVEIPQTTQLITLTGVARGSTIGSGHVHNVTFKNFKIINTDSTQTFTTGYWVNSSNITQYPAFSQPDNELFQSNQNAQVGAIHLHMTDHITLTNIHVVNSGTNGIYSDRAGSNLTIQDSKIEHSGWRGIALDGTYIFDTFENNTITDVEVSFPSELTLGASGIELANNGNSTISYCNIHDGPRRAVWVYGDSDLDSNATGGQTYFVVNDLIDHVKIARFGQDSSDAGALGMSRIGSLTGCSTTCRVNTLQQILIDSTGGNASNLAATNGAAQGVYLDNDTAGQVMSNIWVTNTLNGAAQFKDNATGSHVLTNCSYLANGTANGSFNSGLVDSANIGTRSAPTFPY